MAGREPEVMSRGGGRSIRDRMFGRRRTWLVDAPFQVRSAVVAVIGMAFLLVFAAALFHLLAGGRAGWLERRLPFLLRSEPGDLRPVITLVAVGLVCVAAVFIIEIFETHKTAGVVHKVTRGLHDLKAGRWGTRVTLRRNDNFKDMEEAFNAAAQALCAQADQDLRDLLGIEDQVNLAGREFESGNREGALVLLRQAAAGLRAQGERKRNLVASSGSAPEAQNPP